MLAFLFDRKSGTVAGLAVATLAVILFVSGVLVGLHLRWSREAVIDAALHPAQGVNWLKAEAKAKTLPAASDAPAPAAPAPPAATPAPAPAEAPDPDWVPMMEGGSAPPPDSSSDPAAIAPTGREGTGREAKRGAL